MLTLQSNQAVQLCDGLTRRDFLRVGALGAGAVGLSLADLALLEGATGRSQDINCIVLFLVGGPSQLDTWDPKPAAPDNVRGPFRPIHTKVAGMAICEHFPRMAAMADRYALVRSVHHEAAPIHETGHQLMQTGYLSRGGIEHPHYGSVVSHLCGARKRGLPPFVVLPSPIGNTGVSVSHGQTAGYLGAGHEPFFLRAEAPLCEFQASDPESPFGLDPERLKSPTALLDAVDNAHRVFEALNTPTLLSPNLGGGEGGGGASAAAVGPIFAPRAKKAFHIASEKAELRARYGRNTFGQSCLLARRLIEHGVRLVTVNMFDTVFDNLTWDCHADGGSLAVTLDDYKETLCPMFDLAYTALLDDLKERGMLQTTLVVAMGEFGRTPQLNPRGGRDHWPGVWTILFAGGGTKGGQIIGSSDKTGSEPKDRPVQPADVAATIYQALGIDLNTRLPGPEGRPMPLTEGQPIAELFRA